MSVFRGSSLYIARTTYSVLIKGGVLISGVIFFFFVTKLVTMFLGVSERVHCHTVGSFPLGLGVVVEDEANELELYPLCS